MSRAPAQTEPAPAPFATHIAETLKLALPIIAMRAGLVIMVTVDTILVGRYAADQLAYFSLGVSPQIVLMVAGLGLLQGTSVLISQAVGGGRKNEAGGILITAIKHALFIGVLGLALSFVAYPLFTAIGQSHEGASAAARITHLFAPGLPAMLIFSTCSYYLEATGRQRVPMMIMIGINILNLVLDYIFVFGWGPVPEYGAAGAIGVTTALRFVMMAAVLLAIFTDKNRKQFGIDKWWPTASEGLDRKFRNLGLPTGAINLMDVGGYRTILFFATAISLSHVAAFEVTNNLLALCYMLAVGTGATTSIRVGRAVGKSDMANMRRAGWAGLMVVAVLSGIPALLMSFAPALIAGIYISEPHVNELAQQTIRVAGLLILTDCLLGVTLGALRGTGNVWGPAAINLVGLWIISVPSAWIIGIHYEVGAVGLVAGLTAGIIAALIMALWRWQIISGRTIAAL